jgi:hypothetical protein
MIPQRGRKPATRTSTNPEPQPVSSALPAPDVILDFVFDDGLFFVEIKNIGTAPAVGVKTTFSKRFTGAGGERDVSRLLMFRNISFLAPGRGIRTFLDSSDSYFRRKQPTQIDAMLSWRDPRGNRFSTTIRHDLGIYADIILAHPLSQTTTTKE